MIKSLGDLAGEVEAEEVGLGEEAEVGGLHEDLRVGDVGEGSVDGDGEGRVVLAQLEPRGQHDGGGGGTSVFNRTLN